MKYLHQHKQWKQLRDLGVAKKPTGEAFSKAAKLYTDFYTFSTKRE